ncbi:MAG: extracellular solute-binding protein [Candidatus Hatepunaea meridiana]|nr:extracellular solute-binding protein [Candidatus Hatepunaea meridiana]
MKQKNNHLFKVFITIITFTWLIAGCGGSGEKVEEEELPKFEVTLENVPPGALPDLSAELGGEGFTGEGWLTNEDYESLKPHPDAKPGGRITWAIFEFPATLRITGKDSNSQFVRLCQNMVYESLIGVSSIEMEFVPSLATHWKVSEDYRTFWFRMDPNARFSDGSRVTTADVIASWKLRVDEGILAPYVNMIWGKYEEPVAESPYILRVHTTELNWKFFLYFGGMSVMPAKYIGHLTGKQYMKVFQFEMPPGSGLYTLVKEDIKKGRSIAIKRRDDYWDKDNPKGKGFANFEKIKFTVIHDEMMTFEKFKKGELDFYMVGRAQWWKKECDFENIKRGLIKKRKIFNDEPQGVSGFVFNMREEPFKDIRMRQAFTYLFNRKKLMSQLFFDEYIYSDSYYPGGVYENPNNPKYRYDPEKAVDLLKECGWTERNEEGWLVNDKGEALELDLTFAAASFARILTIYQEDLEKVGIKLNLRQSQGATMFKMVNERKFKIHWQSWGGLLFPNPENDVSSWTADPLNTNNLSGVKNDRIDELIKAYNVCFDQDKRVEMIREIDGILMEIQPFALGWFAPHHRVLFWNKFNYPECIFSRTGDWRGIMSLFAYDEDKAARLEEARKDPSIQLEVGKTIQTYWPEYNKKHGRKYELKGMK